MAGKESLLRGDRQLGRLEVLTDSVYALVIVLLVTYLPTPREVDWTEGSPFAFLASHREEIAVTALGLLLLVSYWIQSNAIFGSLARTDNRLATLAIVQVLLMLLYLFTTALGLDFAQHEHTLVLQSGSLLLMGVTSIVAWRYALREPDLIAPTTPPAEIERISRRLLPEPITAAVTLVVAPFGANAWGLAWLSFPLVYWLVSRGGKSSEPGDESASAA